MGLLVSFREEEWGDIEIKCSLGREVRVSELFPLIISLEGLFLV